MDLATVWFAIIAFFWTGYFILEGFDFGVGALLHTIAGDTRARTTMLNTITPVWDGNEVWLVVAAGATFAAFPAWYATMFSAFYLPLLVILVALIVRALGLEYRGKRPERTWRRRWDIAITAGSIIPALAWGLLIADMTYGIPIDAAGHYTGTTLDLFTPYGITAAATTAALFTTHGAIFTALKTTQRLRERALKTAAIMAPATLAVTTVFLTWTAIVHNSTAATLLAATGTIALTAAMWAAIRYREGIAFTATTIAIAVTIAAQFAGAFPNVVVSSLDPGWSLTVTTTASSHYTLTVMTITAGIIAPLVLAYQGWTYWVFRNRITQAPVGAADNTDGPARITG